MEPRSCRNEEKSGWVGFWVLYFFMYAYAQIGVEYEKGLSSCGDEGNPHPASDFVLFYVAYDQNVGTSVAL